MDLYKWQKACLAAWERNGCRGIVRAATGAGKTRLALEAIRRLRERESSLRVKIVVPTIPLARQWQSALCLAAEDELQLPGFSAAADGMPLTVRASQSAETESHKPTPAFPAYREAERGQRSGRTGYETIRI